MSWQDVRHHYEEPEDHDERPHWHLRDAAHNVEDVVYSSLSMQDALTGFRDDEGTERLVARQCWGRRCPW
jgi:hypothetical protein